MDVDPLARQKADLLARLKALSPERRALLEKRLQGEIAGESAFRVIPRRPREGPAPLSFAQEQLWLLEQLEPGNYSYNLPAGMRFSGQLDLQVLERAVNEIVRRHEALRTAFQLVAGQPAQCITPRLELHLEIVDLQGLPEAERETQARRAAIQFAQLPFDLAAGPLLRVAALKLGPTEHLVLLVVHHIVYDGWSMDIFLREMMALYYVMAEGQPSPLAELPIQYADYATWQREWLQGPLLEGQLAYWRKQLRDAPVFELPSDYARPSIQTYHGTSQFFAMPQLLSELLKALSQQEGVTLFMLLTAAFNSLLYAYTGQTDILVGTDVAGRPRAELEQLIGFFVNPLVLRTNFSGNPQFREVLQRVRTVILEAFAHQELPFHMLVQALEPRRDLSRNPFYQIEFILQTDAARVLETPSLRTAQLEMSNETAKFDLSLNLMETRQGLTGWAEYNTDLFKAETISRLIQDYQALLSAIAANPDQNLESLVSSIPIERREPPRDSPVQAGDDLAPTQELRANLAQRKARVAGERFNLSVEKQARLKKRLGGQ